MRFCPFRYWIFSIVCGGVLFLLQGCVRDTMCPVICDRIQHAQCDKAALKEYGAVAPQEREFSYEEVIARVLCKNLEMHVKDLDTRIAYERAFRENLRMLPHLEIEFERRKRNNNPGSSSESLVPGIPPAPPSVSTERRLELWNQRLHWNLIDFGIAYYVTRQATNAAFVVQMEYKRLRQNLVLQATEQYWIAVAARKAILGSTTILEKVEKQQQVIEKYIAANVIPQMTGLQNQATLFDVKFILQEYQLRYEEALQRLGELMGVDPGEFFTLKIPKLQENDIALEDVEYLGDLALINRPELFAKEAELKVRRDEVIEAGLRMIPGFEVFLGDDYNSNRFLVRNQWFTVGFRLLWDLFNVPNYYQEVRIAKKQKFREVIDRLKVSMSVLAQLHLAYIRFEEEQEQLGIVRERSSVKRRLTRAASKELLYGELNAFEYLQYEKESLLAEIQYYETYGQMMYALEQVNNAMGIPFYFAFQEEYEYTDND